jgi:hypothetical protein
MDSFDCETAAKRFRMSRDTLSDQSTLMISLKCEGPDNDL